MQICGDATLKLFTEKCKSRNRTEISGAISAWGWWTWAGLCLTKPVSVLLLFCCWPTVCSGWGDGVGEQGLGKALERLCENNCLGFGSTHQVWKDQLGTISIIQEFISEKKMVYVANGSEKDPSSSWVPEPYRWQGKGEAVLWCPCHGGSESSRDFQRRLGRHSSLCFLVFHSPQVIVFLVSVHFHFNTCLITLHILKLGLLRRAGMME